MKDMEIIHERNYSYKSGYPFKVIKMINGEDVIVQSSLKNIKMLLVVEYPMSVVKNQIMENENRYCRAYWPATLDEFYT